jgi:hypothetical protein
MVSDTASRIAAVVGENPLLLAAFGVAAGAALGALLPRTSGEDAWLGEAADIGRAAGDQLWAAGTNAAEAAARAGVDAARAAFNARTTQREDT